MRVGIVGLGIIGAEHARSWNKLGVELHAFSPDSPPQTYGEQRHESLESLLAAVDVVDICTPTDTHAELTLASAAAGRHVIVEKPLARTVAEGVQMIEACRNAGVQLHVAHVVRWFPQFAAAQRAVTSGKVGQVGVIRLGREGPRPARPATSWLFDEVQSGGLLCDLVVHDIDYARWIAGDIERVYARGIGAPVDHSYVLLTHKSGVISHLTGSWRQPGSSFRTRLEISGSSGLVEYDSHDSAPVSVVIDPAAAPEDTTSVQHVPSSADEESPYTTQLREILSAIQGGPPPRVSAEDGLAALRVALSAVESIRTGRAVELGKEAA